MRQRPVLLLALSHFASDLNQGALPAMLPLFIAQRHFSYSVAASLVLATNAMSSFLQPAFGWWADRRPTPWLASAGLLVATLGMALAGAVSSYAMLIAAVALSGLGLAAFHPEAARLVHRNSAERRGSAMGMFTVGGNAGFAAGPIFTTALLVWLGLKGSLFLLVPSLIMAPLLFVQFGRKPMDAPAGKRISQTVGTRRKDDWPPFLIMTIAIVFRSVVFFGLNTFLPLYFMGVFGNTKEQGSMALSVMLVFGALGTLAGGLLADKLSKIGLVRITMCVVPFLLLLFVLLRISAWAMVALALLGFVLYMPFSVMVVLGQEYLPNRIGISAGVTIGLAGTVGGLAAPLLGHIADIQGIHAALVSLIIVATIGGVLPLTLRAPDPGPDTPHESIRDEEERAMANM
jgi:FSR family fosmidomycin resistance protein-like MFS transporter